MNRARAEIFLEGLPQSRLDWLLKAEKIPIATLMAPSLVTATRGVAAHDGRFDYHPRRPPDWLAFEEEEDFVFWLPGQSHTFATAEGRAFALGEANITNSGTYCFDGWLQVFPEPLAWLKAARKGIVIVDWQRVFERLRDVPRILAATYELGDKIDTLMHPARLPAIAVREKKRTRATNRGGRA